MKTQVFQSIGGLVARIPTFMPDRKRSFRRLRPVLGRDPVAIKTGGGYTVYAARDSIAVAIHFARINQMFHVEQAAP